MVAGAEPVRLLLLRGRTERRVEVGMPVFLARLTLPDVKELAVATDAGEHGVCVVTNRFWRPGDSLRVSSLSNDCSLLGKVAYCWRRLQHTYCTGVTLDNPGPRWWETFSSAA